MNCRTSITTAAILAALFVATTRCAVEQEKNGYLKKPNPNELYVQFRYGILCPGSERSYDSIIDRELVRARINRLTERRSPDELFLDVHLDCRAIEAEGMGRRVYSREDRGTGIGMRFDLKPVFTKTIHLKNPIPNTLRYPPSGSLDRSFYHTTIVTNHGRSGYFIDDGFFDRADRDIRDALREETSALLLDYIKVNIDQ